MTGSARPLQNGSGSTLEVLVGLTLLGGAALTVLALVRGSGKPPDGPSDRETRDGKK